MEEWFETFFGLQKDGKVNPKSGLPNPFQWAVISREYEDEIYLASPPLLVQRVRFGLLATIGKLLGYKARYPAYSGAQEPLAGREGARPSAASGAMRGHRGWGYRCVNCAIVASTTRPFGQKKIASVPTSENSVKANF